MAIKLYIRGKQMRLHASSYSFWLRILILYSRLTCVVGIRSIVETHKLLMVVQHFSAETDSHTLKNTRSGKCIVFHSM